MNHQELLDLLRGDYPEVSPQTTETGEILWDVPKERFAEVARALKERPEFAFDSLMCLSGLDMSKYPGAEKGTTFGDQIACVYHLHSFLLGHEIAVRVLVPREGGSVPSVETLWPVAGFFEREIYDLLGVNFPGNHDLRRLMMPEDWVGHPLRKDYQYPAQYHGWDTKREGQSFTSGPYA